MDNPYVIRLQPMYYMNWKATVNIDCEVWYGVDTMGRGYDAHPQYGGIFLNLPLKSVYFGMPVIDNVNYL